MAALRKSVSRRQRPICPMVKEAVGDLDAAKLAECSGRLAPGWLASAKDRSANKAKQSEAKGRKLAELEVGELAAAEALEKGKAAVAAVAEEW